MARYNVPPPTFMPVPEQSYTVGRSAPHSYRVQRVAPRAYVVPPLGGYTTVTPNLGDSFARGYAQGHNTGEALGAGLEARRIERMCLQARGWTEDVR